MFIYLVLKPLAKYICPLLTAVVHHINSSVFRIVWQVFYYQDVPYPPTEGRFKGHAVWSGDIMKRDVSITLHEVPPTFNGTYICQVRNPPDVHGSNGEIILKVVNKG